MGKELEIRLPEESRRYPFVSCAVFFNFTRCVGRWPSLVWNLVGVAWSDSILVASRSSEGCKNNTQVGSLGWAESPDISLNPVLPLEKPSRFQSLISILHCHLQILAAGREVITTIYYTYDVFAFISICHTYSWTLISMACHLSIIYNAAAVRLQIFSILPQEWQVNLVKQWPLCLTFMQPLLKQRCVPKLVWFPSVLSNVDSGPLHQTCVYRCIGNRELRQSLLRQRTVSNAIATPFAFPLANSCRF